LQKLSLGFEIGELVAVDDGSAVTGYYPLTDAGNIIAYIIKVIGAGYADDLNLLSAISIKGKILSAVLMENSETPGLGKEAENASYMEMFTGKGDGSVIPFRKSQLEHDDADSITGASITFIGIGKALNKASEFAINLGGM
ncbi:MAG: FMN-binding protein, partial [Spirochaetales bacterium]|nr:FMN-binding protein [Spirochaetales bacterium]